MSLEEILCPPERQSEFTALIQEMGAGTYKGVKLLDDGTVAVFARLIFTHAIMLNAGPVTPCSRRYCFDDFTTAIAEWQKLTTCEDAPTGWIARRPEHD